MKKYLNTGFNQELVNLWLLVFRVLIAVLMLRHGIPKFIDLIDGGDIQFANPIGIGPAASLILVVFAEALCSILIGIGLGTRLATIPQIINMLVIFFIVHGSDPFGRKELPLMYLLVYITILVLGGGKYSVDYLIAGNTSRK